jgi:hypothetical protein
VYPTNPPPQTPSPTGTAAPCDGDLDANRQVTIAELIRAVNSSVNGCPGTTP